ncbi:hypothetical protein KY363_03625 [Candidatus Woesearchaeota archaeon]|nr:hypothetical protein [Candidatus Woesearchaeota archaeon]
MNIAEFMLGNLEYILRTEPGSVLNTVRLKQPRRQQGEKIADLHAHPYITTPYTFFRTLDTMVQNNVDMLAMTTHGNGNKREMDFQAVRNMLGTLSPNVRYRDMETAVVVEHGGKELTLVGAYEMYTELKGVRGKLDVLALMPDAGFEEEAKQGMTYQEYAELCREYNGIVVGAHPYTLWDPYGPDGLFRFRLADKDERLAIRAQMFTDAESIDQVSSNAAWMVMSNHRARSDFLKVTGRPCLSNSDAHSNTTWTRNEIGRSGNLISLHEHDTGQELREELRKRIIWGDFRTYTNYTPALQFLMSIALDKPSEDFP